VPFDIAFSDRVAFLWAFSFSPLFYVCTKRFTNNSYSSLKRFARDNIADPSGEWLCDSMTALGE